MTNKKLGRRAPKNAPALKFSSFMKATGTVPAHPASEDYLARLTNWQVLGNDKVGDCNAVTWANMRRLVTASLAAEYYPTQEQVYEFYKTQNPSFDPNGDPNVNGPGSPADQGMDVQTGLEYLHTNGGPDGVKPVAFAKLDPANKDEVEAALAIFGGLWLGVVVLSGNMTEFDNGQPWTDSNSQVDGGHAILGGGYDPRVKFITWGTETEFDDSFWNGVVTYNGQQVRLVEEAWVVIWPEHLVSNEFMDGVNVQALAGAYEALTGKTLNIPTPPAPEPTPTPIPGPTPAPTPNPTPTPPVPSPTPDPNDIHVDVADERLAEYASLWAESFHVFNRRMRHALVAWLLAKGLI